ncbi:hypothetical protein MJL81_30030, partial [Salmonella enterica subsp. enterica serovar Anatum]|nr:hypothetical protein [Salmonella enterica subsp. enterica serovar Anatum]
QAARENSDDAQEWQTGTFVMPTLIELENFAELEKEVFGPVLHEPLKGMNTAFVSSIYGVVCAILLTSQSVFVRSSYSLVSTEIK